MSNSNYGTSNKYILKKNLNPNYSNNDKKILNII